MLDSELDVRQPRRSLTPQVLFEYSLPTNQSLPSFLQPSGRPQRLDLDRPRSHGESPHPRSFGDAPRLLDQLDADRIVMKVPARHRLGQQANHDLGVEAVSLGEVTCGERIRQR